MKHVGIDITLLGPEEWCCGSPLFRTGQLETAKAVAQHNIVKLSELGVKIIIFSCVGCYRTFQTDYPKYFGKLDFKIESIAERILLLIKEKRLEFRDETPIAITYHDPYHSYRIAKKPDLAPRKLIKAIPWMNLIEMKSIEKGSMCCGAGGGLKAGNPDLALKIASKRLQQVIPLNVKYLVSTCPFCKRNLADAQQTLNFPVDIVDLVELTADRLK